MLGLDEMIRAALPGRERAIWRGIFWGGTEQTIIGYGDITQKRYFSLYVNAVDDGLYLGARYAGRLGKVKIGASSISFGKPADLETAAVTALLRRAGELAGSNSPSTTTQG